jgi:DNA-binding NtrC family response regulator
MSFRNILIVDANAEAAGGLSRTLAALGYHVEVARSAAAALQLVRSTHFDVGIFSEWLPDGDGAALFQRVAAIQSSLKGVLLAAVGNLTVVWSAVSAGMQRVLIRPVDVAELLPIVEAPQEPKESQMSSVSPSQAFDELTIGRLTSDEIRHRLSREELITVIQSVDYPFAGKDRLPNFDRDTLERVVHLVRRWCQARHASI